eukprot:TRINITY_DN9167_c1_g3_i1.p1 TRINITY_DN9167_c1_g3~~TRINITY_DN9167_c1_g3_i1.p1  ORF type:complete len:351 (+),score=58.98 TRINITY_DN9167_c1_g3_i1:31-1083(+)
MGNSVVVAIAICSSSISLAAPRSSSSSQDRGSDHGSSECPGDAQAPVVNLCSTAWPGRRSPKLWAVMFYSPRCGHCDTLKPKFRRVAQRLKDDPELALGVVDCTEPSNRAICIDHKITGYPTVYAVGRGEPVLYKGGADAGQLGDWLEKIRNSTRAASARCPRGPQRSDASQGEYAVPLCRAHFPSSGSKHSWAVVLYDKSGENSIEVWESLSVAAADLGNEKQGLRSAGRPQKQRERLVALGRSYGLKLKVPAKGLTSSRPLAKVGAVCCDCQDEEINSGSSDFCAELLNRAGSGSSSRLPKLFWVEKGLIEASSRPVTSKGLVELAVGRLGFLASDGDSVEDRERDEL